MSLKQGAKTKAWIKHNGTGETRNFQFNPTDFQYSRTVDWEEHSAPGQPYPNHQFVKGNARVFTVELFIYDTNSTGRATGKIINDTAWLGSNFLTPENNVYKYTRPADFTFCYGPFIRKCVLDGLDIHWIRCDDYLQPIEARVTLTVRQVGTDV